MSFIQPSSFKYNNTEYLLLRLSFGLYWFYNFHWSLWHFQHCHIPVGIAKWITLDFLALHSVKVFFTLLAFTCILFYFSGKYLRLSLGLLFILSLLVFSAEESAGVFYRVSLLTMIWFAQLLATILYDWQQQRDKITYFSVQIIAAAYLLAAYSKWTSSGISWVSDAKYFDLQVLKGEYFNWASDLQARHLEVATRKVHFVAEHLFAIQVLLTLSLVLETFALFILRSKKWAFYFGICLSLMHLGIYYMMDIFIAPVAIPMLLFLINPMYQIVRLYQAVLTKFRSA